MSSTILHTPVTPADDALDDHTPLADLATPQTSTDLPKKHPFLEALGERVRALRSRRGMTRKALAQLADVSERHLANLEQLHRTGRVDQRQILRGGHDHRAQRLVALQHG